MEPRWPTVLAVTPYVVLALLVAFTIGIETGAPARLAVDLVLCAAYGAWVLVFRTLPTPWRGTPAGNAVLLVGVIVLNAVLVLHSPWFGVLVVASFPIAYSTLRWPWEVVPVAAIAVIAGWAQGSTIPRDSVIGVIGVVAIILVNVGCMTGLSAVRRFATVRDERAGVEAERARLAREIHDTLAQGFAGIVTQLQAAEQAPDEAARDRHTASALALAREGLTEARRSVQALRPAALDVLRLPAAVASAAAAWSERTRVPVEVRTSGAERPLPIDTEVALLRTAQEALANVERHAGAHRVAVELRFAPAGVRLEVHDDGRGFDPGGSAGSGDGGFGLVAMRERIESLAGAVEVESAPGRGTAVRAEVPA